MPSYHHLPPQVVAPPPVITHTSSKTGMRSFFSSSPKKLKEKPKHPVPAAVQAPVAPAPRRLAENLARYLKPDGTLARAFIAFKDVAHRCDTRLFETAFPLIGQRLEPGNKVSTLQVGELCCKFSGCHHCPASHRINYRRVLKNVTAACAISTAQGNLL